MKAELRRGFMHRDLIPTVSWEKSERVAIQERKTGGESMTMAAANKAGLCARILPVFILFSHLSLL
jgi:hypothetical protein